MLKVKEIFPLATELQGRSENNRWPWNKSQGHETHLIVQNSMEIYPKTAKLQGGIENNLCLSGDLEIRDVTFWTGLWHTFRLQRTFVKSLMEIHMWIQDVSWGGPTFRLLVNV